MSSPALPPAPSLRRTGASSSARAVVLLLHGGQEHGNEAVTSRSTSWLRMALMQHNLSRFACEGRIALWLLRYRVRGWNATPPEDPDPVRDALWALARTRETYPGLPIVVVGHSMGARTACRVAADQAVVGVCALAPWLPEAEPVDHTAGRHLAVLHGTNDPVTSAALSKEYVHRAQHLTASASWESVDGAGHYMLHRTGEWNAFVRRSVSRMLQADHGGPDPVQART